MTTPPPETLRIDVSPEGTLRVAGELDVATAPQLRVALDKAVAAGGDDLELDISGLDFCDSSGLSVLVHTRNNLPGRLILHGASAQIRRLLRTTKLDSVFTVT